MKLLFVISALFLVQVFGQEAPAPPSDILECFAPIFNNADQMNGEGMLDWATDVRATSERLRAQRQRCDEIPRDDPPTTLQDRMIQACMAAWNASFAYESARLMSELQSINPEMAAELREILPQCFGREPAAYYRRILRTAF